jgi:hypothetical protein
VDNRKNKSTAKIRQQLYAMTAEELSYMFGRYCGPSNELICVKKFGRVIPPDLVLEILGTKVMEEAFFLSEDDDKIE